VRAQTEVKHDVFVVPQRVVTEMQGSYQVTVIDNDNKAHAVKVEVGDQQGSNWIVEKGLQPGQRIVVEGLEKAKDGAVVNPKPWQPHGNNQPAAATTTNQPPSNRDGSEKPKR
jgi:membrane fusion protein (multidrug efflux system)